MKYSIKSFYDYLFLLIIIISFIGIIIIFKNLKVIEGHGGRGGGWGYHRGGYGGGGYIRSAGVGGGYGISNWTSGYYPYYPSYIQPSYIQPSYIQPEYVYII
jgi:hypothetical protein